MRIYNKEQFVTTSRLLRLIRMVKNILFRKVQFVGFWFGTLLRRRFFTSYKLRNDGISGVTYEIRYQFFRFRFPTLLSQSRITAAETFFEIRE